MKKPSNIIIISLLLICLLAFSSMSLIFGNYASAYPGTCAANFLPTNFVEGVDTSWELWLSQETADYIAGVLNSKYPIYDIRDTACTANNFKTYINAQQSWDTAVIYSKGHLAWKNCPHGYGQMGLAMYNGTTIVLDTEIYDKTSSKNVHSFIWHCRTGLLVSDGHTACLHRGLPVAFTHNDDIPWWGTSGSQVYLGWYNKTDLQVYNFTTGQYHYIQILPGDPMVGSPQYEWGINPNYNYANVAATYYYRMKQGDSTAAALVQMSSIVYGHTNFENTELADWLVVYGNMYTKLP